MKMSPKQKAVFQLIARGEVKLWVSGYGKVGERVLVALTNNGRKANLQVDWLLARELIVLGDTPASPFDGQEIRLTPRGEKIIAIV